MSILPFFDKKSREAERIKYRILRDCCRLETLSSKTFLVRKNANINKCLESIRCFCILSAQKDMFYA